MNDIERRMIEQIRVMAESLLTGSKSSLNQRTGLQKRIIAYLKEKKESQNLHQIKNGLGDVTTKQVSDSLSHCKKRGVKKVAPATYQWGGK